VTKYFDVTKLDSSRGKIFKDIAHTQNSPIFQRLVKLLAAKLLNKYLVGHQNIGHHCEMKRKIMSQSK
jgi:hypothetical protein